MTQMKTTSLPALFILLSLLVLFSSFPVFSQDEGDVPSNTVLGTPALDDSLKMAFGQLEEALQLCINSQLEQCLVKAKAAVSYCERKQNDSCMIKGYRIIARIYRRQGKFEEAVNFLLKRKQLLLKTRETSIVGLIINEIEEADTYMEMGRFDDAREHASMALQKYNNHQIGQPGLQISILSKIGFSLKMEGKYSMALEYFQKMHNMIQLHPEKYSPNSKTATYNGLAVTYRYFNDFKESIKYLKKTISISEREGEAFNTAAFYNNLGNAYRNNGEYGLANQSFFKSIELYQKAVGKGGYREATTLANIGLNYVYMSEFSKAEIYYENALKMLKEIYGEVHFDIAYVYNLMANLASNNSQLELAIEYYDKALAAVGYDSGQIEQAMIYSPIETTDALYEKTKIYLQLFNSNKGITYLYKANETAQMLTDYLEKVRKENHARGSISAFMDYNYEIYEIRTNILNRLNKETKEGHFAEEIFALFERSKSFRLLETIRETNAKRYAGVADSLIKREKNLKKTYTDLEVKYYTLLNEQEIIDSSELNKLNIQLQDSREQYFSFLQLLEKDNPRYYALKYDSSIPAVSEIQQSLTSEQALIEYFLGDSSLFAFQITKENFQVKKLPLDTGLVGQVEQLRQSIYGFPSALAASEDAYNKANQKYVSNAHRLYQQLVAPLGKLPKKLIIIPDDILNYIPFEVLLTGLPDDPGLYPSHPYLIRQHQISYCYSAALLEEMRGKKAQRATKNLLAVAPEFKEDGTMASRDFESRRQSLGPLKHNIPEAESIRRLIGGDVLKSAQATESRFVEEAPNYRILHLATHAKSNDQDGDYSFLAFNEIHDSLENEKLYVRDLYNLTLDAEMVVLSACETGIGELQRGEGVISLARGFVYAGAGSLVTSLWSVDDLSTKQIMELFYQNLKSGQTKDAALRNAKLTYLASTPQKAHPFFWAAFAPIGNMESIELGSPFGWGWYVVGVVVLLVGGYFFWSKK